VTKLTIPVSFGHHESERPESVRRFELLAPMHRLRRFRRSSIAHVSQVASMPILRGIPICDLETLAGRSHMRTYRNGQPIVHEGEDGEDAFLIIGGDVEVVRDTGQTKTVAVLHRGDLFGEIALLTDSTRNATVCARNTVQLVSVPKIDLVQFVERNQAAARKIEALVEQRSAR
jgi:CRP-like cAMP-binding protein